MRPHPPQEPKNDDVQAKIHSLNRHFTELIYENVCRSLFQDHKAFFSFMVALGIDQAAGRADTAEVRFLASGPSTLETSVPNPDPSWITDAMWREMAGLAELKVWQTKGEKERGVLGEPKQRRHDATVGPVVGRMAPNTEAQGPVQLRCRMGCLNCALQPVVYQTGEDP